MKKGILRFISVLCAVTVILSCLTLSSVNADEPVGKMSAVYAYVLNDYLYTYGALSTREAGETLRADEENGFAPRGVIHSEVINFDANENPYLVIFFADSDYSLVSCHIWKFDEETEEAKKIAALDVNYSMLSEGQVGAFVMGFNNEKRYIIYRVYENDALSYEEYYTAIDGDAFMYVNAPGTLSEIGVADFSGEYIHPNVDVSDYNANIGKFFDELKNTAADSVTYEDIAERLTDEDEEQIEAVLKNAVNFNNFDIADYATMDEYRNALTAEPTGDRFYLISEAYSLGDEIYYIRFSTDRSYYNYALLRRSPDAENGYQILKVRTDCIPLSDRELKQIKRDYDRNTLLYKKAKGSLKLLKESKYSSSGEPKPTKEPVIQIDKPFSSRTRLPVICVGGGVAVALLTILWVYLYSDND